MLSSHVKFRIYYYWLSELFGKLKLKDNIDGNSLSLSLAKTETYKKRFLRIVVDCSGFH